MKPIRIISVNNFDLNDPFKTTIFDLLNNHINMPKVTKIDIENIIVLGDGGYDDMRVFLKIFINNVEMFFLHALTEERNIKDLIAYNFVCDDSKILMHQRLISSVLKYEVNLDMIQKDLTEFS